MGAGPAQYLDFETPTLNLKPETMSFMFCFCITLEPRVDYMRLKYEPSWEPLHISAKRLFSNQVLLKTAITGLSFRKNNHLLALPGL